MRVGFAFAVSLMISACALAQQATGTRSADDGVVSALPDAPLSQDAQNTAPKKEQGSAMPAGSSDIQGPFGPIPALLTRKRLTLDDKFTIYAHQAFGPPALIFPAFGAGIRMAHPPNNYPREWIDGGGAFGRLYGSAIATQTSKRTAAFLTGSLLHEDPRYLSAAQDASVGKRIVHAVGFTVVDRTDSGRRTFAFANFASAAAGGFVGMAYLPDGFNDTSHAGQRALSGLLEIGIANISREFAPQWGPVVRKLHLPKVVPVWWVPGHPQHP